MKYNTLDFVNRERFSKCFEKYVGSSGKFGEGKSDIGGYLFSSRFVIRKNIGIRRFAMFFCEELCGEITKEGQVRYGFRKRAEANIFTLAFPLLWVIGGVLLTIQFQKWYSMIPFVILAVFGFSLRFFHSKENRERLLSTLNAIIYEANH